MTQNITINYLVKQTASERNEKYDSNTSHKIKTDIESRKSTTEEEKKYNDDVDDGDDDDNNNNNKRTWSQVVEKKRAIHTETFLVDAY